MARLEFFQAFLPGATLPLARRYFLHHRDSLTRNGHGKRCSDNSTIEAIIGGPFFFPVEATIKVSLIDPELRRTASGSVLDDPIRISFCISSSSTPHSPLCSFCNKKKEL